MSPRRASEYIKAWVEYRKAGGKGGQKEFSRVWRDKERKSGDKPSQPETKPAQEITIGEEF